MTTKRLRPGSRTGHVVTEAVSAIAKAELSKQADEVVAEIGDPVGDEEPKDCQKG